jgi:2-dehydropantoate 2-reductase
MRITIIGTGALACLFGADLAPYAEVSLFGAWQEQIEALNTHGLKLRRLDGQETIHKLWAVADNRALPPADIVLVLVKSSQTEKAAWQARALLAPGGLALTLQNGLGNFEKLQAQVGAGRAVLGVTMRGANIIEPGVVAVGSEGLTTVVFSDTVPMERLQPFCSLCRQAGIAIEATASAESIVWGKLAINAGINPVAALLGMRNGYLVSDPSAEALMRAAAGEVEMVAHVRGISLLYADAGQAAYETVRRSVTNRCSMLQDMQRGAPTEIDAICGAVCREAEKLGLDTPVNRLLWQLVRAAEGRSEYLADS